ncbi:LINE-1 reverse transcriptase isogeny [Gossypium australe]|uniref:LINE-1 reverse transcriptase isogeny n=1 Tax=Gossypium australe TaxID=47621 RepID=A0A5B6WEU4_9ROSI|nr:LINE-1 reverse transcriptase isogeny [Gossypium australe]
MKPEHSSGRARPFCFLADWTKHSNFPNLVKGKWSFSESVLIHEELLRKQKAKCDWLNLRDQNTKYFHSRKIQRRKFNHITTLQLNNGEWSSNQNVLHAKAGNFFQKIYRKAPEPMKGLYSGTFPHLSPLDIDFLNKQWDILGKDVCEWVKKVFTGKDIDPDLNNTLFVLIPKVNNPESFMQFRPISLCYVIVNRFKLVFLNLISQQQAGFIFGRIIHSMKRKRSGRKWMAIKIDLVKLYDRVG